MPGCFIWVTAVQVLTPLILCSAGASRGPEGDVPFGAVPHESAPAHRQPGREHVEGLHEPPALGSMWQGSASTFFFFLLSSSQHLFLTNPQDLSPPGVLEKTLGGSVVLENRASCTTPHLLNLRGTHTAAYATPNEGWRFLFDFSEVLLLYFSPVN